MAVVKLGRVSQRLSIEAAFLYGSQGNDGTKE